ncbi:mutt/nudix hydrolase [Anaeramoeba flamelloides]|uniref:Mutt/nudix hydrolase n=1 Tax=Anaeramoeba flamelloides TaxID=1746091 RepID=A0AAV7ZQC8_9EUKA|nr:mutt/nudix hydrolase [Anaeramoeba flamelloides]
MDGKHTVFFTVMVYIIEDDKIVMIQEAKSSCKEKWYIPAGKMQLGEDVFESAKRETLEEAGVEIENPKIFDTDFRPYFNSLDYVRFHLTATISGGSLKTLKQKDKESMQAKWIPLSKLKDYKLRCPDFIPYIKKAQEFTLKEKIFAEHLENEKQNK